MLICQQWQCRTSSQAADVDLTSTPTFTFCPAACLGGRGGSTAARKHWHDAAGGAQGQQGSRAHGNDQHAPWPLPSLSNALFRLAPGCRSTPVISQASHPMAIPYCGSPACCERRLRPRSVPASAETLYAYESNEFKNTVPCLSPILSPCLLPTHSLVSSRSIAPIAAPCLHLILPCAPCAAHCSHPRSQLLPALNPCLLAPM